MINYCPMFIILGLMFSTATESVGGCFVQAASVVVTVGQRVLLTCSTNDGSYISSWHIPIDVERTLIVYAAPVPTPSGTVAEILAKGYFVAHPANNESVLHINETNLSQAGLYVCTCLDASRSTAATTVVVLNSEPKFVTDDSATDGKPVTFSCSVSFNASSDVSCELQIGNASGSTVTKATDATVNNGLVICNLNYTIIANASSPQWCTCHVTLNTKGDIIYSRVLNAALEWREETSLTNPIQKLRIGLPVAIFAVVIIAVVVYFTIRSKYRDKKKELTQQRSMGQLTEQQPNCPQRPAANRYDKNIIGGEIPAAPATSCLNDGYYAGGPIYTEVIK